MADIKRYKEAGYVVGYEDLVKTSNDDLFPEYLEEEAWESITEIHELRTRDSVSFAFMTDNHYMPAHGHDVNLGRTMNTLMRISHNTGIDRIFLGGDHTVDGEKKKKIEFLKSFKKHLVNFEYFPVNGNHDDGTFWDMAVHPGERSVNHLSHKELKAVFYDKLPKRGLQMGGDDALYYMYDDNFYKIRYVFLDVCDIPYIYENGILRYRGQDTMAMSQRQTDWLINKALKFEDKGWSVLFISHWVPLHLDEEKEAHDNKYLEHLTDIVDAYKNRENIDKVYYDGDFELLVKTDFKGEKRADVMGFLIGHNHVDRVSETKSGIPVISTGNAGMFNSGMKDGVFEVVRKDGDKSEILFDIVTIDKTKRKIYLTRVGEGEDREIGY